MAISLQVLHHPWPPHYTEKHISTQAKQTKKN
jgi:hypothetical protein